MSSKLSKATDDAGLKESNPADLDQISLTQALRDFEIANARVLDLTQRLVASERQRRELENELEQLRSRPPELDLVTVATWGWKRTGRIAKRVLGRVTRR